MAENVNNITWSIRPCRAEDIDAMREICIETSSMPLRNEKDRQLLLLMFCDSYLRYTSDCFVAVNGDDIPVGYILCAPDTCKFFRELRKNTLPQIKKFGTKYSMTAHSICFMHTLCVAFAPAHLHIDLTESARRRGIGTALMDTLKKHLAKKGISRVQLTCASKNKAAVSFYKHNGFKTVFRGFGSCVMRSDTDLNN